MVRVDDIKASVSIDQILADDGIYLKRGRCTCPLHGGDNTTSFSVKNGFFHCFACGESGDVIRLVQKLYGLDFREAAKYLAQKAGILDVDFDKPLCPKREPRVIDSDEYFEREQDEILDLLIRLWERVLKRVEEDLKNGKISLSQYYADEQWAEFQLSRLDEESIMGSCERNRRRNKERWKRDC